MTTLRQIRYVANRVSAIRYVLTLQSVCIRDQQTAKADRDPHYLCNSLWECGSLLHASSSEHEQIGQCKYAVVLAQWSPFHYLKSTWPSMIFNDLQWPFSVSVCFPPMVLEVLSLSIPAWLTVQLYWMLSVHFRRKGTRAASRVFCDCTASLFCWRLWFICCC